LEILWGRGPPVISANVERSCSRRNTIYMGKWDGKMKHLANLAPEDFVHWLIGDAEFYRELSTNFASRDLDGDAPWLIAIKQMPTLLHLEFQVKPDPNMGRRLWEYNTEASIKYEQPVKSVVIYLKK